MFNSIKIIIFKLLYTDNNNNKIIAVSNQYTIYKYWTAEWLTQ